MTKGEKKGCKNQLKIHRRKNKNHHEREKENKGRERAREHDNITLLYLRRLRPNLSSQGKYRPREKNRITWSTKSINSI